MPEGQGKEQSGLAWLLPYAVVLGMVLILILAVTTPIYVTLVVLALLLAPVVRWRYRQVRREENEGVYVSDRWRNAELFPWLNRKRR